MNPESVTKHNAFRHPDAHPVLLDMLTTQELGLEWFGWEPEATEVLLREKFSVSSANLQKLNACKALHTADTFWHRWEVFGWISFGLEGVPPDTQVMQVPDVVTAAIAISISQKIRDDVRWSHEVKLYLGAVCRHDGLILPPPPLDIAEVENEDWPVNSAEVSSRWPEYRSKGIMVSGTSAEDEQLRRMLAVHQAVRADQNKLDVQLRNCV